MLPNLNEHFSKLLAESVKLLKEFHELTGLSFEDLDKVFTNHGWFVPGDMNVADVFQILRLFNDNKIEEADEILINHFSSNLKSIETNLKKRYPVKSKVLSEAFICHKKKLFYASTMLFLSQADGLFDGKLFSGKYLKNLRKKNKDHWLLKIFHEENTLNSYYDQQKHNSINKLNRHGVMHGVSNEYGNLLNSCKALSLICLLLDYRIIYKK